MRSHEKIKNILEKSQTMNHYDAIGIITIITIVGLVINAIRLIQYCNSPKAIALIIKNGGPLVRLFVKRNIYKSMIKSGVSESDAKILSDNFIDLVQSLSVSQIQDIIETVFKESKSKENE
jgi:hypothetical protein